MTEMRLQRYLSQAGVAARRKAEELITSGAVTVNGKVVTILGTKIDPRVDRVRVDGQAVYPQEPFYVVFNKPKGCITAVADPEGRLTVMDYLYNLPVKVVPVGRLDFNSEGVLLLTNDGDLAARLQSPDYHVEKTYHVKVRGQVSDGHLAALRRGVRIGPRTMTRPAQIDRLHSTKSQHDWLVITLTEGKSRQIHRMLDALGYMVLKLQRVAFAGLTYHGLRVGDARELTQAEVNQLRELVDLPKTTGARGSWSSKREKSELARRAHSRQMARRALDRDDAGPMARSASARSAPGPRTQTGRKPAAGPRPAANRSARTGEARGRPAPESRDPRGGERARSGRTQERRGPGAGGDRRGPGPRAGERTRTSPRGGERTRTGPARDRRGPGPGGDRRGPGSRESGQRGRGPGKPAARGPGKPAARGPGKPAARGPGKPAARGPGKPAARKPAKGPDRR